VLGSCLDAPVHVLQASREPVALSLELLEAQQARPGERVSAGDRGDVRKAAGDDRRQLALELCHLHPQRTAGRSLGRQRCG
jgi:hypothetical protein